MKALNSSQFHILENVPDEVVERLRREVQPRDLAKGEVVYQKGDLSDDFYFLISGKAQLQVENEEGVTVILGILKVGYCFGMTGLFPDTPRQHTVVCDGPCRVAVISGHDLRAILEYEGGLGLPLLWNLFKLVKDRLDLRTDQLVRVLATHPDLSKLRV
ncbi:Crp/Fnr family transcriptional regulator [Pseudodesulfovibrio pelocollis]|uniref:Crp/Fnr family transcriptional regulator n=1 Tax=Pseudodesulfovibrio pelocollis TaxID=3051432 RepID=UPI00255AC486|nr:cyclic nucleotide-binding domain-containing protein [Pseudodesulfovibrio sp. SB368]